MEKKEDPQQQYQAQRGFIFLEAFVAIKRILYLQQTILFLATGFPVSLLGHLLRGPDRRCVDFEEGHVSYVEEAHKTGGAVGGR